MNLKKGFLQPSINHQIPLYRYILGVVLGLLMAFYLYALQFMTREAIRWLSISDDDLWLLSDKEVDFYNLIFAFISVIVAQSICFSYWFDRPRRSLNARPGRLRSIVNDQRFLNWYFLAWFSKVATMYGFLFCTAGLGGFYTISFYPSFNYLFVLIIIVLFFQVWNTILLTFKRKAYKWMIGSSLIILILSFGLSRVNLVDYKSLNDSVIKKRLETKYHLRLPKSIVYENRGRNYINLPNLSIAMPKNDTVSQVQPLFFLGGKRFLINELPFELLKLKNDLPQELQVEMPLWLKIDQNVPMTTVRHIAEAMTFINVLHFVVIPQDAEYNERYYTSRNRTYFSKRNYFHNPYVFDERLKEVDSSANRIRVRISPNKLEIDEEKIRLASLADILQNKILGHSDYEMLLYFSGNLSFETYFNVIASVHSAVSNLRNQASLDYFDVDFRTLKKEYRRDDIRLIQDKFPLKYIEIWNGFENHPHDDIQMGPLPPWPRRVFDSVGITNGATRSTLYQ